MSVVSTLIKSYQFNRVRTLGLLDKIEELPDAQAALGWRPGKGRAHIAWQLMHIGVTEELFASERLAPEKTGQFQEYWPRFRGGSTPDDNIPAAAEIRRVLSESRAHLVDTLSRFGDDRLGEVFPFFKERGLTLHDVLNIISWHESHHQGQAHITLNLFKNRATD
jgi:uncharacterized damage-inducible protein DinB